MEPINIAVFGSSGAIGKALCIEFSKNKKINKIFAFSRNGDQLNHQSIISKQVDYLNEDSLHYNLDISTDLQLPSKSIHHAKHHELKQN